MTGEPQAGPKISNQAFGWGLKKYLKPHTVRNIINDAPDIWRVDAEFQKTEPVVKGGVELGNAFIVTFAKALYDAVAQENERKLSPIQRPEAPLVHAAAYNTFHRISQVVINNEDPPPDLVFLAKFLTRPESRTHLFGHHEED